MLYHPAHIDGRTVVVLRSDILGYTIMESGLLKFDGESLSLACGEAKRHFSEQEVELLKPVAAGNRIPECRGFDFFLIQ